MTTVQPSDNVEGAYPPDATPDKTGVMNLINNPKNSLSYGLNPEVAALLELFLTLAAIPRPSHREELATQFVCNMALAHGWEFKRDRLGNVVIYVPGNGAGADAMPVALQAHLDMVCVPDGRDFFAMPISIQRERREVKGEMHDVLFADGSTLGADNGIGVATAFNIALSDIDRPPLELVFTVNEEDGMTGVKGLKHGMISAEWLINIDSEDFGVITQSCAGGMDLEICLAVERNAHAENEKPFIVELSGLPGGHSGVEVHEGRGNANLILARCLNSIRENEGFNFRLASFDGGDKRNALPSTAKALVWCDPKDSEGIRKNLEDALLLELGLLAPEHAAATLSVEESEETKPLEPMATEYMLGILSALSGTRDGVLAWSKDVPGLVETSSTLSLIRTKGDEFQAVMLTRSSQDGAVAAFQDEAAKPWDNLAAEVVTGNGYCGWPVDPQNPLLDRAKAVFAKMFGREPRVEAIHAGLETGLLRQSFPHLKMISIGPDVRSPHSVNEMLFLDTLEPFWNYFKGLISSFSDRKRAG